MLKDNSTYRYFGGSKIVVIPPTIFKDSAFPLQNSKDIVYVEVEIVGKTLVIKQKQINKVVE